MLFYTYGLLNVQGIFKKRKYERKAGKLLKDEPDHSFTALQRLALQ